MEDTPSTAWKVEEEEEANPLRRSNRATKSTSVIKSLVLQDAMSSSSNGSDVPLKPSGVAVVVAASTTNKRNTVAACAALAAKRAKMKNSIKHASQTKNKMLAFKKNKKTSISAPTVAVKKLRRRVPSLVPRKAYAYTAKLSFVRSALGVDDIIVHVHDVVSAVDEEDQSTYYALVTRICEDGQSMHYTCNVQWLLPLHTAANVHVFDRRQFVLGPAVDQSTYPVRSFKFVTGGKTFVNRPTTPFPMPVDDAHRTIDPSLVQHIF